MIGENLEEVKAFIERMMDYLKPKGVSQEIIAEKIIELAIRLKRIGVIEAGVFNQEMLEHERLWSEAFVVLHTLLKHTHTHL